MNEIDNKSVRIEPSIPFQEHNYLNYSTNMKIIIIAVITNNPFMNTLDCNKGFKVKIIQ